MSSHAQRTRIRAALVAFATLVAITAWIPSPARAAEMCDGLEATITGTEGDDVLDGTSDPDVIVGLGGNDTINGLGGDDVICGGPGDDVILGGWGSDRILGEDGNDTIDGEGGADDLDGGKGKDAIDGGIGNDAIDGGGGKDVIDGGPGGDELSGNGGADQVDGSDGNDTLTGGGGNDTLRGGAGADHLSGNAGDDVLKGQDGDDLLEGGDDADVLWGGMGIDDLNGGAGDDWIHGGNGPDELRGRGGDDELLGRGGDDTITGQGGVDIADGGPGDDDCLGETEISCEQGLIDFVFDRFYINQAVPAADSDDAPADMIEPVAGRAGILRAFFSASRSDSNYSPTAILHWKKTGGESGEIVLDGPGVLKKNPSESNLNHTHDYVFDETFLEEGMQFYVEVDGEDDFIEASDSNNRYPSAGWLDPGVIAVPTLEITFVPIGLDGGAAPVVTEASALALLEGTIDMHPITDVDIVIHDPIDYETEGTFNDWTGMLEAVQSLDCSLPACQDGSGRAFAGIVGSDPSGLGVAGIGYVNTNPSFLWPYSVNRPISETLAHELGHNFGRAHVACSGFESSPDQFYPYDTGGPFGLGGHIGTWGYESDTAQLKDPATYNDLMTYCNNEWISDYTYGNVLDFRTSGFGFDVVDVGADSTAVTFAGSVRAHGASAARIADRGDPRARLQADVADLTSVPIYPEGTHRIVGVDAAGRTVMSDFFPVYEIADTLDVSNTARFSFAIAVTNAELARIASWEIHDASGLVVTIAAR